MYGKLLNMKLKKNLNVLAFAKSKKIKFLIISTLIIAILLILFLLNKRKYTRLSKKQYMDKVIINCNGHEINADIAKTPFEREYGLMNVKYLEDNQGMLFVFQKEQKLNFWMKNTYIPLDIVFLDKDKQIINIYPNCEPLNTNKIYTSSNLAKYAIETNANWFSKNNIHTNEYCNFDIN